MEKPTGRIDGGRHADVRIAQVSGRNARDLEITVHLIDREDVHTAARAARHRVEEAARPINRRAPHPALQQDGRTAARQRASDCGHAERVQEPCLVGDEEEATVRGEGQVGRIAAAG